MHTSRRQSKWFLTQALVAFSAVVLLASMASAQGGGGRGGPQLSPEEQGKVWTLQAQGVAKDLGLADDLTAKVVEAYNASRTKQTEALRAAMQDEANRGPGMMAKMQEISKTEREALKAALAGILNAEQTDKALAPLGTFSRQWDRMVNALLGLGVDAEKQGKALPLLSAYAVDADAAMQKAMAGGDREAARTAGQERKEKLDTDLAGVLSAEELTKWKEATAPRGGGGGRRGDREGGGAVVPAPGAAPAAPAAPAEGAAPAAPGAPKIGGQNKRD